MLSFRIQLHPTLHQAEALVKYYSTRDRKEMKRIARLESDRDVFEGSKAWTPFYHDRWREWLQTKGPDTAIVFCADES